MLIDTHAHIYLDQFHNDLDVIISNAKSVGVNKILMPNIDQSTVKSMLDVETRYPHVAYAMMGLHPCSIDGGYREALNHIEKELRLRSFIAIGEIGIDLYWDKTFIEEQKKAFIHQAHWAEELKIPIVIHCRDSIDLVLDLLENERIQDLKGVFHCFGGDRGHLKRIKALNFHIGIGGVITYKNSGLKDILTFEDLPQIVLETDAPYLSPVPYRGKRNESAYVLIIGNFIAESLELPMEIIEKMTTENAMALFGIEIHDKDQDYSLE